MSEVVEPKRPRGVWGRPDLQTRSGAIWSGGACRGDLVAETPVLRRGFAGGYGFQGAVGHFGLLLVCRFFAAAQNDRNGDRSE